MKSNSLVSFRKKSKRVKLLMLLFCFMLGAVFRLETVYHTLRVKDVRQSPEGVLTEKKLWECFSYFEKNCFPVIFVTRYRICKKLERHYPAKVRLILTGWGKWCFSFGNIKPIFRVSYRGKDYYLNSHNKLWSVDLKENENVDGEIAFNIPKLIIANDIEFILTGNDYGDFEDKRVIFDTSIDVVKLKLWYNKANELGWLKYICACCVQRDRQQFFIKFYLTPSNPDATKSVIVLDEDVSSWNAKDLALKKLWGGIDKIPQGLSIEAHLKDKILAKPVM